ncbi:ribonuclease H-like domain-containing protein [Tanacetum coccineum]|uniref:Ribonuclease H-like domain-containing protein n=1 Tax=Tanacetum coccineum TaxID=301880 RepID=A0ABQ5JEL8_9ASTR
MVVLAATRLALWQMAIHKLQLDVKNAFLHGCLSETVYMHQRSGVRDPRHPNHVCLLQRSLYELKQALKACLDCIFMHTSTSGYCFFACIVFMTDIGPLNYSLGIYVTRNTSGMFLSQSKYATEVLERANMLAYNPCRTPVDTYTKLAAYGDPVSNPTLYRSLAGALKYLMFTRPDISYVDQQVCLFMHDPREPNFSAVKRILRYYVFLGNNLPSWSFKRHFTHSRSSAEAKYRGVANEVAETCWLHNLLHELYTPLSTATIVYCDNVSAVYLSSNLVQHQRTKHIEIDINFVRGLVTTGHVRVLHVPSRYIFTKGLPNCFV